MTPLWTRSLFPATPPSPYLALSEPSFLKRCVHLHLLSPPTHSSSYPVQFLYPALPTGLDDTVASDFPIAELRVQCLVLILLDPSKVFHWAVLFLFLKPFLLLNFKRQHTPGFLPLSLAALLIFPQGYLSFSPSLNDPHPPPYLWTGHLSHSSIPSKGSQLLSLFLAQTVLLSTRPVHPAACLMPPGS